MLKPRLYIVGIEHPSTGATSFPAYEPGPNGPRMIQHHSQTSETCNQKYCGFRVSLFFFSVRKASIMHSCSESNQRCERACDLFTRAANKLKETFSS